MSKPQAFTVSHLDPKDFAAGLRSYARYRDLGMAAATSGAAVAQVIKFVPPCTDEVRVWHTHDVEFQMIYVLRGWIETEMEGRKPEKMQVGSAWLQPPNISTALPTIPMTAKCSKSCCRRTSRRRWCDRAQPNATG